MKTRIIIALLFFCSPGVWAQDPAYSGPAKSQVNSFWIKSKAARSLLEKGMPAIQSRIADMESELAKTVAKDPAYNTSQMKAELIELKQRMDADIKAIQQGKIQNEARQSALENAKTEERKANDQLNQQQGALLDAIFDGSFGEHKIPNIKAQAALLQKNLQELLAMNKEIPPGRKKIFITRLLSRSKKADETYPKQAAVTKTKINADEMQVDYYMFLYNQAYWQAAKSVFPDEPAFAVTWSQTSGIIKDLGTPEGLVALAAKNYEQKKNETRLPPAKARDAELEALFMDLYNTTYGPSYQGKALKAIITTTDWTIQRNELTGIVTGRLRRAAIVYKNAEGQCWLVEEFYIKQEYVGNSFTGTTPVYAVGKGRRCSAKT